MEIVKEQKNVKRGNGSQQGGVIALQPNVKRREEKRKERYNYHFWKCMSVKRISKCFEYFSFIGILH